MEKTPTIFNKRKKWNYVLQMERVPGIHSLGSTDQLKGLSTLFAFQPYHPVIMRPLS